jgi:hypothetical protein
MKSVCRVKNEKIHTGVGEKLDMFPLDYHPLHGHGQQKGDAGYIVGLGYNSSPLHIHLRK